MNIIDYIEDRMLNPNPYSLNFLDYVSCLENINSLKILNTIDLSKSKIRSIDPLYRNKTLKSLTLDKSLVTDIEVIKSLDLSLISIGDNIKDLNPLENLEDLDLDFLNHIDDIVVILTELNGIDEDNYGRFSEYSYSVTPKSKVDELKKYHNRKSKLDKILKNVKTL